MKSRNIRGIILSVALLLATLFSPSSAFSQVIENTDMDYFINAYTANYDSLLHHYYFRKNKQLVNSKYKLGSPATEKVDFETVTDSMIYRRLLLLNTKVPLEYNPIVRGYVSMYLKKMNHSIDVMLSMAEYYFPMFEEVLDKYGVPCELKYLAIIESALNTNAVSKAGATGLWQFMMQTGRNYDLEINTFVDERRDPLKATHAAARYLRDLNRIYNNWPLAIASYNCGPGNVNKAIARSGGARSFWGVYSYLPRETRGYIPAYIAAVYMMNFYGLHGLHPKHISIPTANDTVVVHKDVDFASVQKYVGISIDELKNLNPQYKLQFIPQSEKGYALRLPTNKINVFLKYQDSIYSHSRDSLLNSAVKEWKSVKTITHRVRKNETVGRVAEMYGVSAADIRRWNNLSKKAKLKSGQRLIIYKKTQITKDTIKSDNNETTKIAPKDSIVVADTNDLKPTEKSGSSRNSTKKQGKEEKKVTVAKNDTVQNTETNKKEEPAPKIETKKTPAKPAAKTITHTVKSGENLFRIAQKYNTTVDKIKKDNNLKNDNITVGRKLVIKK